MAGVERLVEMAKSPMEDVKHQALITLSKLSPKPEYQESLLRSAPVVPTMHSCFASNAHVRRCAVTILADMCSSSAGQRSVASGLGITQGQVLCDSFVFVTKCSKSHGALSLQDQALH